MTLIRRSVVFFLLSSLVAGCSSETTETPAAVDAPAESSTDVALADSASPEDTSPKDAADETTVDAPSDLGDAAEVGEVGSGTRPACSMCTISSDCLPGMVCTDFGIGSAGRFCAYKQSDVPAGDCTNVRPYRKAESVPIVGGGSATICWPAYAMCQAIGMFKMKCTSGKSCGVGGDCWARSSASFVCTLECADDYDCPVGSSCELLGGTVKRCLW